MPEVLDAFVQKATEFVPGAARVQLHKGHCRTTGVRSRYSLYSQGLAEPTRALRPMPLCLAEPVGNTRRGPPPSAPGRRCGLVSLALQREAPWAGRGEATDP